jgi:hypothetical protein
MRAVAREAAHYRGAPRAATVLFALIIVFTGHCLCTAAGKVGQRGSLGRNDWKASQVEAGIKITNKAPVSIYIHSMKRAFDIG